MLGARGGGAYNLVPHTTLWALSRAHDDPAFCRISHCRTKIALHSRPPLLCSFLSITSITCSYVPHPAHAPPNPLWAGSIPSARMCSWHPIGMHAQVKCFQAKHTLSQVKLFQAKHKSQLAVKILHEDLDEDAPHATGRSRRSSVSAQKSRRNSTRSNPADPPWLEKYQFDSETNQVHGADAW